MKIEKTDALVLQHLRWRDSSLILHLFTAGQGYFKVIAKGALRPKSPLRGTLENLNLIEAVVSIRESRGLQVLSQASLLNPFSHIRENLEATAVAYSILELIKHFVQYKEEAQELFKYTVNCFNALNRPEPPDLFNTLLRFILFLSNHLGFGWNFDTCRLCGREAVSYPLTADLVNGAVICRSCAGGSPAASRRLSEENKRLLSSLQKSPPDDNKAIGQTPEWNRLLQIFLDHLNYHTGELLQLKSLKMFLP